MISLLHVCPIYRENNVPFTHPRPVGRTVEIHIIHVRDHFYFLLLPVVDPIALQREAEGSVAFFHDDGASSTVLFRFCHCHSIRLHSLQNLWLCKRARLIIFLQLSCITGVLQGNIIQVQQYKYLRTRINNNCPDDTDIQQKCGNWHYYYTVYWWKVVFCVVLKFGLQTNDYEAVYHR